MIWIEEEVDTSQMADSRYRELVRQCTSGAAVPDPGRRLIEILPAEAEGREGDA